MAGQKVLVTLESHSGGVRHVEFSPDGQRVLTNCAGASQTWNAIDGRLLATFKGSSNATFSPDDHRIVASNTDSRAQNLVIWDAVNGGELLRVVGQSATVLEARFSPDGRRVVTINSDGTANVWDAADGELVAAIKPKAAFSRDLQRLLTTTVIDGATTVQVWSAPIEQDQLQAEMKVEGIREAKFSPDGNRILTINRTALRLKPNYAEAHLALGMTLQNAVALDIKSSSLNPEHDARLDEAITEDRKAVRLMPESALAHFWLASAWEMKGGHLTLAIVEYRKALHLEPNDANTHYRLAEVLKQKGDLDGAIGEYREALSLKPEDANSEMHYALASALDKKGDLDAAIGEYRQADDAQSHYSLGSALERKGN